MAVMAREAWTDDQLDKAFVRVDADLRELRAEVRGLRSETVKGFERVDDKFDAMRRNMTTWFIALFSAIVTLAAAVIAAAAFG
jgi:hypothetical protein